VVQVRRAVFITGLFLFSPTGTAFAQVRQLLCTPGAADAGCSSGFQCYETDYSLCEEDGQFPPDYVCGACFQATCAVDTDCGPDMACVTTSEQCMDAGPEAGVCTPFKLCTPRYQLACQASSDCGDGFTCAGIGSTPCPATEEGVPVNLDCETTTPSGWCQPDGVQCGGDGGCPSLWSCNTGFPYAAGTCIPNPIDGGAPICEPGTPGPGICVPPYAYLDPAAIPIGGVFPSWIDAGSDGPIFAGDDDAGVSTSPPAAIADGGSSSYVDDAGIFFVPTGPASPGGGTADAGATGSATSTQGSGNDATVTASSNDATAPGSGNDATAPGSGNNDTVAAGGNSANGNGGGCSMMAAGGGAGSAGGVALFALIALGLRRRRA
jgi:hypothetical protein